MNCDKLDGMEFSNGKFKIEGQSSKCFSNIYFNYKPLFVIKVYDTNGNLTDSGIFSAYSNEKQLKIKKYKPQKGIYFIDLSGENIEYLLRINHSTLKSGFIEVI